MKFLVVLLSVAALSFAGGITATGGTAGTIGYHGSDAETVLWSQPPTGYAMSSQNFTEPEYDSGVADDVEFATETTINKIRFWGGYWNGTNPVPIDSPIEIYLYMDDGTGNAPTLPEHTSAIASWIIPVGDYTEVADGANYMVEYVFPTWVVFEAGQKYWIEYRKAMPFAGCGQYGWVQAEPITLSSCVQGFPALGTAYWTAQSIDAAFELIWDDAVSLDRETWAGIKSSF